MGADRLAQRLHHAGNPGIGVQVALFGTSAHVRRTDEEYPCPRAALVQTVYLSAHLVGVSLYRAVVAEIRDRVAAELEDDEPHIHQGVSLRQLVAVDLRELVARATTHRDIVHRHTGTVVHHHAVEVGSPLDGDAQLGGGGVEPPVEEVDARSGVLLLGSVATGLQRGL